MMYDKRSVLNVALSLQVMGIATFWSPPPYPTTLGDHNTGIWFSLIMNIGYARAMG